MIRTEKLAIKQGFPKKRNKLKTEVLRKQLTNSISTNILDLDEPDNSTYGFIEMNVFFHSIIGKNTSGNLGVDLIFDLYGFNLPDQQTVSDRTEKLDMEQMERKINFHLLERASKLPTYSSEYKLAKVKDWMTKKRRDEASRRNNSSDRQRLRQREREINPPDGRYLALDFTLKPFYTDQYDQYIDKDHKLAPYLIKNRSKASTSKFLGYHTVYDYEIGSRQILSVHMKKKYRKPDHKDGWKREKLGDVVEYLMDPILEKIPVTGIAGDGDYYNRYVISYLESKELDYVIKATKSPTVSKIIEENDLENSLDDGEAFEYEEGRKMTISNTSEPAPNMRLIIAKRGEELETLVLPKYSELTPEQALLVFEERFGIETSYREVYKYLPQTSSLVPEYRLALYAMTSWFLNILFNYYQLVVVFSQNKDAWEVSLERIKDKLVEILGKILMNSVG